MVQVENISKSYGSLLALDDINMNMERGEIVGLLGINGAGKSTLMKILSGIVKPDIGIVNLSGCNLLCDNIHVKKNIGYLSEDNPLYEDMYVTEYLNYVANIYRVNAENISLLIERVGLVSEYKKKIGRLSRGNRQRVGIAQALLHDPEFLILDEPTGGLDPNQRDSLNQLFVELAQDKVILFSTHILQDVKDVCTRFVLLDKGRIVADESINNIESVEDTFRKLTNEDYSR